MPEPYNWISIVEVLKTLRRDERVTRQSFERRGRAGEWDWAATVRPRSAMVESAVLGSPWLTYTDGVNAEVARLTIPAWVAEFSLDYINANDVLRRSGFARHAERCRMWASLFRYVADRPAAWTRVANALADLRPLESSDGEIFDFPLFNDRHDAP